MSIISKIQILVVHSVKLMKSIKLCNGNFFNGFTYLLVTIGILSGCFLLLIFFEENNNVGIPLPINVVGLPDHLVTIKQAAAVDGDQSQPCNPNCSFWDCFNVYRCGQKEQNRISIFVYPLNAYVDTSNTAVVLTKEYYSILEAVVHSDYYTSNPNKACLFLPSIDLLNQNLTDAQIFGKALVSLDYWENGENHLIFNMFPGRFPIFNKVLDIGTDKAIIIGGGFDSWTYRPGFDISFPVLSPLLSEFDQSKIIHKFKREHLLIVAQLNLILEQKRIFIDLAKDFTREVLFLQSCTIVKNIDEAGKNKDTRCNTVNIEQIYKYPDVLLKGTFCFMGQSVRLGQPDFLEILAHNCIPVLLSDNYVLPFEDVIDWSLATISFRKSDLYSIVQELKAVSHIKILELQQQGQWLFQKYFNDIRTITLTALEILNDRVFPHLAKSYHHWNTIDTNNNAAHNPLFLPLISLKSQGFTAVILTYDRVESLFTLIQKLSVVSSLQSILVIWNNQRKAPPHLSMFPKVLKPLKVIQTNANKLSNRFYPYDEIETESVLTIDDDIVMLTGDELNFGFEVWREFPDRIVGFPSRVHIWDNETMRWRYESEWTNQISMVLTGVAFHHKYWSYMYTNAMPGDIKNWVDEHMNCEDIAMNFLVSYITKKPPIKVAPRKKFKCPECTNTEMLSADLSHMMERSACINRFAKIYGYMPLKTVEFRADPVLYKDNFPEKLKQFNDIGSL